LKPRYPCLAPTQLKNNDSGPNNPRHVLFFVGSKRMSMLFTTTTKLVVSSPRRGGGFVAHRVSGGYQVTEDEKPRQGRQKPTRIGTASFRRSAGLSPLRGLTVNANRHPPLTRWATNLWPHPGPKNDDL
jgi:hypothetical protein